ncbi:unnamed protein product [Schistosoma margrebowiei]|uniref:Uncharacterized protein n=1 Tax=Schistosoma margrebowiei TaxID=48269 RepID=A0A183LNW8_9TREM|nr:unnamed protein product [Schistosoma margrebowiei]
MQEKTTSVAAASAALGLNIHKRKSKILKYNTASNNPITLDGEDLEDVKTFTYLGSIINEYGGSDADVKARFGKARAVYLQLKNMWNSKQLSINTKITIFNTNVKTVLLCGAETWRTTKATIQKIQVTSNGLANQAGLEVGDVIVSICNSLTVGKTYEQVKAEILRAGNELDLILIRYAGISTNVILLAS